MGNKAGRGRGKRRTSLVFRAVPIFVSGEREVRRPDTDERVGIIIGIVSEAVSQKVPGKGTDAGVEEVLEQNVLDVPRPYTTSAQCGKPGLHQEDQRTRPHEIEGVQLLLGL